MKIKEHVIAAGVMLAVIYVARQLPVVGPLVDTALKG
jgi:hypothetical protein